MGANVGLNWIRRVGLDRKDGSPQNEGAVAQPPIHRRRRLAERGGLSELLIPANKEDLN